MRKMRYNIVVCAKGQLPCAYSLNSRTENFMHNLKSCFRSAGGFVKSQLLAILATLALIITAAYIGFVCSSDIAVKVAVNGQPHGYIDSVSTVINAAAEVDRKIYSAAGEGYTADNVVTYSFDMTNSTKYLTEDALGEILWSYLEDDFCEAYMLYVDGVHAAANESGYELLSILGAIEEELVESAPKGLSQVKFSNRLKIEKQLCTKSSLKSLDEINILLNPLAEEQRAELAATYAAQNNKIQNVKIGAFDAAVPAVGDGLGTVDLIASENSPLTLNYSFVNTQVVNEIIFFDTVYTEDASLYEGTEIVTAEGSNGRKIVEYEVLYDESGDVISRNVISETILVPAVPKEVTVGTRVKPAAVPTGTFIWPCEAPKGVSSYYGWRDLNGRPDFHLGIDMPDNVGSPIWAADGGEVVWVGCTPSYGNSIRIQHGDKVTVYAHLDTMSVNIGDKVFQGQEIGTMGNTGVAYGTHLHFEIRINGSTVNPIKYLPER